MKFVERYVAQGRLPTLGSLIAAHGLAETSSEARYEDLEPWIQWVTAHTGLSLKEHGVFRLGDAHACPAQQIWEHLERLGLSVAAVSPMNAVNRTKASAFFIPDPWTQTDVSGGALIREFHRGIVQAVSENAQRKVDLRSFAAVLVGWLLHFRLETFREQVSAILSRRGHPWRAALFLDRLLCDVFLKCWQRARPDFSSVFVNAGAHVQHHYMYSSAVYDGPNRNPAWYLEAGDDPVLEAYQLYDEFLAELRALPDAPRLVIATGLHQEPQPEPVFYYRLKDHRQFLSRVGIKTAAVVPLMSRDFRVEFRDATAAEAAAGVLASIHAPDGIPLFDVDNRGGTLFVMLTYPHEIKTPFVPRAGETPLWELSGEVAFVALKNGRHNGTGYLIDTGWSVGAPARPRSMHLSELYDYLVAICTGRSPSLA